MKALWLPDRSLEGADVAEIAAWLRRERRRVLATRTVDEIAGVLDRVAERWLDPSYPLRERAVKEVAEHTGFSPAMVAHAIELEQVSSRKGDILQVLDRELGDRRALDGWIDTPRGRSMAIGPEVVGGIFSANIPALPHLTVMRSFLVKAACLGRVSRGEPVYLPLYAESLLEIDPELARCLAVVWWDATEDRETEAAFLGSIDHLIAYGGDGALGELRSRSGGLRATWHGHRMGFAWIGAGALGSEGEAAAIASKVAYDFSVFDQHACLAPQACFVERGGAVSPERFAELLATEVVAWLERLPPRRLTVDAAAGLRSALDRASMAEVMGGDVRVLTPPQRLQGSVIFGPAERLEPSPLDRSARVVPVSDASDVYRALEPVRRWLQCAAVIGVSDEERSALAALGVTRLCPPGAMGTPSMVWAHDGRPCLADLVRWCDEETRAPGS